MTETHATTRSGAEVFPPGRYGRRRAVKHRRPWLAALLAAAVLAAGTVIAVRLYGMYGDPTYDAEVITYTEITDAQIVIDFRVTVPPGGSAVCALRARSYDGTEVGHAEVRVNAPPGQDRPVVRHRLATSARPHIGEVLRCRAAD